MGLTITKCKPGNVLAFVKENGSASTEPSWMSACQKDGNGKPLDNLFNVLVALRGDPLLSNALAFDLMLQATVLMTPLFEKEAALVVFKPRAVTDTDTTTIQEYLQQKGLRRVNKQIVSQAIDSRSREKSFHPVRDYMNALKWDGVIRLPSWLSVYLGAAQTPYTECVGRMFFISTAARIFDPGCKVDYMIVLEGAQGDSKSTACAILGGPWYSDNLPDVTRGKDVQQHLRGKMLIEISEMSAMGRAESAVLKAFITRCVEQYRPPYGEREVHEPRQCVFIGTTNKSEYLRDETGNRRIWPVNIGDIDTDALRKDRDQLFAEALKRYQDGEQWFPDKAFEREHIQPQQESRFDVDAWEPYIREFLADNELKSVHLKTLLSQALDITKDRWSRNDQNRVKAILERIGWKKGPKDNLNLNPWVAPN